MNKKNIVFAIFYLVILLGALAFLIMVSSGAWFYARLDECERDGSLTLPACLGIENLWNATLNEVRSSLRLDTIAAELQELNAKTTPIEQQLRGIRVQLQALNQMMQEVLRRATPPPTPAIPG